MNNLLIGTVAFFVIAIGLSTAYAEEGKYVDVTPDCIEIITQQGNTTHNLLECKWYKADIVVTAIQDDLTDEEQKVLDDIKKSKENGTYEKPPVEIPTFEIPEGFNTVSDKIPASCTRNNPSPSDIEECNIDSKLSICQRGLQSTSPIQQYETFVVTTYIPRDDLQIDLQTLAPIVKKLKAYEECRAELRLILDLNETHYVGLSKEIAKGEYNPYHRDFVTTDNTFPSQPKADEGTIVSEGLKAEHSMCNITHVPSFHEMKYLEEKGCDFSHLKTGTYKNLTGLTSYEANLRNTGPMAEFYRYMETDGIGYNPPWVKKHAVTITSISPGTELEIEIPK